MKKSKTTLTDSKTDRRHTHTGREENWLVQCSEGNTFISLSLPLGTTISSEFLCLKSSKLAKTHRHFVAAAAVANARCNKFNDLRESEEKKKPSQCSRHFPVQLFHSICQFIIIIIADFVVVVVERIELVFCSFIIAVPVRWASNSSHNKQSQAKQNPHSRFTGDFHIFFSDLLGL